MFKNYSKEQSPKVSELWLKMNDIERKELITLELKKHDAYKDFEVIKTPENGQIEIRIDNGLVVNERALILLNLESILKSRVDNGITVWCDIVGDKSKLRNLRGVSIST
jgi:hypothetical protein